MAEAAPSRASGAGRAVLRPPGRILQPPEKAGDAAHRALPVVHTVAGATKQGPGRGTGSTTRPAQDPPAEYSSRVPPRLPQSTSCLPEKKSRYIQDPGHTMLP